ncbi:MAG: hypothetical protein BHV69_02970 [Bacteroidales bacterium 52_46]|nr:MAG: hypothetical protein BHV69_02970 [Bacteroidales bacterium 52_46]
MIMETIKLNFNAPILGEGRSITLEVPYSDGIIATSRFCPMELLSGDVELLAALNGEPLEDFVKDCKLQLDFANKAYDNSSMHEAFIAGLMASVLEHKARSVSLTTKEYLLHLDAFSYLVNACGVSAVQVTRMYPKILESVIHAIESQL